MLIEQVAAWRAALEEGRVRVRDLVEMAMLETEELDDSLPVEPEDHESTLDEETDLDEFDPLFKDNGAWEAAPALWGDPENALSRQEFMGVMELCLEKLPPNTARAFIMREVMGLETPEICKELAITANNLWVILYRARMALRQCLEQNWFMDPSRGGEGE